MPDNIQALVELIHASPKLAVIVVAGAGGQALAWLLGVPGASRTVLEAIVPYGRRSMAEFLGHEPAQYVSLETARELAEAAYKRALRLREATEPVVGLACTAAIATDRPKRGDHRCCVAVWDDAGVTTYNLKLAKGRRDRPGEEDVVSRLILRALAEACGIKRDLPLLLVDTEQLEVQDTAHAEPLERQIPSPLKLTGVGIGQGKPEGEGSHPVDGNPFGEEFAPFSHTWENGGDEDQTKAQSSGFGRIISTPVNLKGEGQGEGEIKALLSGPAAYEDKQSSEVRTIPRYIVVHSDGRMVADEPIRGAILPGSFNPLHRGHERLAQAASEMLGTQVIFEISVVNVDKPPLEEAEVGRRLRQFQGRWHIVLTRAPTFREKAALFPGCTFVIGWDTAVRLVDPRYYNGQEAAMHAALAEITAAGCRFLVAGRLQEGVFRTLADVVIPREFLDLFEAIPEARFRVDVSSTELRTAEE